AQNAQHQPLALDQDPPVGKEVDLVLVAAALLFEDIERKPALSIGNGQLARALDRKPVLVVALGACGKIVVLHVSASSVTWGVAQRARNRPSAGTERMNSRNADLLPERSITMMSSP